MARKKIREFDSKRLLQQRLKSLRGIDLPLKAVSVNMDSNLDKLPREHGWLQESKLVVKPDMLFGQRGKHNLVLLNASWEEAVVFLRERLGQEVSLGAVSGQMTHFIVEPFVPHSVEFYMSIQATREHTIIRFSNCGGIEIEENWDKVKELSLPWGTDVDTFDIAGYFGAEFRAASVDSLTAFIRGAVKVFDDLDMTFMEMNPFTLDAAGMPLPLDMRGELDDTAFFKHANDWGHMEFPNPFGRKLTQEEEYISEMDAKTGASLKLTILNDKGHIWNLVAGGGASVVFADTVSDLGYGHELGNYGEYSGGPNTEETYHYTRTLLDVATRNPDGKPRALLIGGAIANFTDVAATFKGIMHALKEFKGRLVDSRMRIYVRRGGPNYQKALQSMKDLETDLGVPIEVFGPETQMTNIIPLAIQWVESK